MPSGAPPAGQWKMELRERTEAGQPLEAAAAHPARSERGQQSTPPAPRASAPLPLSQPADLAQQRAGASPAHAPTDSCDSIDTVSRPAHADEQARDMAAGPWLGKRHAPRGQHADGMEAAGWQP